MIKLVMNPHPNNYLVFCNDEESLDQVVADFEAFLHEKHLRLFVKIGKVLPQKHSFDFRITTTDQEEHRMIMDFLEPSQEKKISQYRVYLSDGITSRFYPTNDLKLAIILFKSLEQESAVNVDVQLYEYSPDDKDPNVMDGWKIWRDREGKPGKDIRISTSSGEMIISNLIL
jgi:hypothetical protein